MIQGTLCDIWWYPGTNDPNKPCRGYWNAKDDETVHTHEILWSPFTRSYHPGLLQLQAWDNSTWYTIIIAYPNHINHHDQSWSILKFFSDISIKMPDTNCDKECIPPKSRLTKGARLRDLPCPPINWLSCEWRQLLKWWHCNIINSMYDIIV